MLAIRRAAWGTPALIQNPMIVARVQPSTSSGTDRRGVCTGSRSRAVREPTTRNAPASSIRLTVSVVSTMANEARDAAASCIAADTPAAPGPPGVTIAITTIAAMPARIPGPIHSSDLLTPRRNWLTATIAYRGRAMK